MRLHHHPDYFCCGDTIDSCIVKCSIPFPKTSNSISDSEVHVMVKTFEGHHVNRLEVLKNTWASDVSRIEYCSDKEDPAIPTINLGVDNTDRGHCAKTWEIFRRFLGSSGNGAKWLVVADDDTLMNFKRLKQMLELYDSGDKVGISNFIDLTINEYL